MTITPLKTPKIYAYTEPQYEHTKWKREANGTIKQGAGLIKVGFTTRDDVETRIKEQFPTKKPTQNPYKILLDQSAIKDDGTSFSDREVHTMLEKAGIRRVKGEWFACEIDEVRRAINAIKSGKSYQKSRSKSFCLRPEQAQAVEKTAAYFRANSTDKTGKIPHFLWNAKMRFGKSFAAYKLAQEMGFTKVLILTFKPAVKSAWREDLEHSDFVGWEFLESAPSTKPSGKFVYFASLQDILGRSNNTIKAKNIWIHEMQWDLIVLDEYHFGAWNDNSKSTYITQDSSSDEPQDDEAKEQEISKVQKEYEEDLLSQTLKARAYLYLSGTPFRALSNGEFLEDHIYNWTYSDEQRAKKAWKKEPNPYAELPQMVMMVYKVPEDIAQACGNVGFNEFDLNEFFKAKGEKFAHEEEVIKWLRFIKGEHKQSEMANLINRTKSAMPYENAAMLQALAHTLWFLPSVAACVAMKSLLEQDSFFQDYRIILCAGSEVGVGERALEHFKRELPNPLESKSITLSCGKLTTGVSVPCWSGVLMLRSTKSPETYFQTAFRAQTPWSYTDENNRKQVIKEQCFVLDFAPNRALQQVSEYALGLNDKSTNMLQNIEDFIAFLPIVMHDGSMLPLNAESVLELAISGQAGSMLARKWRSATLVNVDNATLDRILASQSALAVLEKIEGFRSIKTDMQTIINHTKDINALKSKKNSLEPTQKRELSEKEKQRNSKRKQIQEKLLQFAQKIPVFMYLSDYREESLEDVIRELEPELFKRVTGLITKDFNILCQLEVFNTKVMDQAIFSFKRYEDKSFDYLELESNQADSSL